MYSVRATERIFKEEQFPDCTLKRFQQLVKEANTQSSPLEKQVDAIENLVKVLLSGKSKNPGSLLKKLSIDTRENAPFVCSLLSKIRRKHSDALEFLDKSRLEANDELLKVVFVRSVLAATRWDNTPFLRGILNHEIRQKAALALGDQAMQEIFFQAVSSVGKNPCLDLLKEKGTLELRKTFSQGAKVLEVASQLKKEVHLLLFKGFLQSLQDGQPFTSEKGCPFTYDLSFLDLDMQSVREVSSVERIPITELDSDPLSRRVSISSSVGSEALREDLRDLFQHPPGYLSIDPEAEIPLAVFFALQLE